MFKCLEDLDLNDVLLCKYFQEGYTLWKGGRDWPEPFSDVPSVISGAHLKKKKIPGS